MTCYSKEKETIDLSLNTEGVNRRSSGNMDRPERIHITVLLHTVEKNNISINMYYEQVNGKVSAVQVVEYLSNNCWLRGLIPALQQSKKYLTKTSEDYLADWLKASDTVFIIL